MIRKSAWLLIAFITVGVADAQPPSDPDQEFWKKRVVRRVDLREKINRPLVYHESAYYDKARFTERDGIVAALIKGLRAQQYVAFDPEDWDRTFDYPALVQRMMDFEEAIENQQASIDFFEDDSGVGRLVQEFNVLMEEEALKTKKEWGGFRYLDSVDVIETVAATPPDDSSPYPAAIDGYEIDYAQYEESLHIVEDWIFNSRRGALQQHVDYFEVIWTDPTGQLPEKVLARFRWKDVQDVLAQTQWKNRFNDAEVRSIKEVIELRIFHGYAINVGGEPVHSLPEAAEREREMVEFEHNLWSY